jgi:group I intron endonuclease
MGHIYEIKNRINGKIYIGQTIRPIHKRLEEHRTGKSKGCRAIYNAIQKYGWENFEKDYYECPDEDLNTDEDLLVSEMGTLSPDGYNLIGGGGNNGKRSEETKQKNREALLGKPKSKEHIQKNREAQLGKKESEETKQKKREANRGEKNPMYGRKREDNPWSKIVYQYDLDGIFINSFASSGEAARYLKKDSSHIRECARGNTRRKNAYGFKWSYTLNIFM